MLKSSTRNSAPNRSLNVKFLNTEKSTFLKPESRKMFRPIFPKVPNAGGVRTELPEAKQPAPTRLLVPPRVPWASAAHIAAQAAELASVALLVPYIPLVVVQVTPLTSYPLIIGAVPPTPNPVQIGMEFALERKSAVFPKKSHRSARSPVPLKSFPLSFASHGWAL